MRQKQIRKTYSRQRVGRLLAALLLSVILLAGMSPAFAAETTAAADHAKAGAGALHTAGTGTQPGELRAVEDPAQAGGSSVDGLKAGETPAGNAENQSGAAGDGTAAEGSLDSGTGAGETSGDGTEAGETPGDGTEADRIGTGSPSEEDPASPKSAWNPEDGLPAVEGFVVNVPNKTQLVINWTASDAFDGYEVSYARNILFIRSKLTAVDDPAQNYLTLDGLDTSKCYYVRIRGYRYYEGERYDSEWTDHFKTKGGSADASVKFVKSNGKKLDVRKQAWSKLKNFGISQGSCSDGKYLYMAFEHRNGDDNGSGRARIKIAKVRISDWKVVKVSPSGQKLGHANDMTYNSSQNILVVTGAKTNDPYVRIVSPKTLKKTGTKKIRLNSAYKHVKAFNGLDYDPDSHTYYIRSRNYGGLTFTLDEAFKQVDVTSSGTVSPSHHVQSCTSIGDFFLLPQSWYQSSKHNTVTIYNKDSGSMLQHIKIKLTGELESLFFIGEKLYATVHKHVGRSYMTGYIFQILL